MIATSSRYVPPVLLDRFENLILRSRQPSRENKRRILAMRSPFYESNPFRFVARTLFLKYVYIYIYKCRHPKLFVVREEFETRNR